MFNQNKKKKLDSKVRFQRSGFRKQLENARGYKRQSKTPAEKNWHAFFESLGLGTLLSKLIAVLILMLLIYTVYLPNFLTIRSVQINGLVPSNNNQIHSLMESYLVSHPLWPQNNLLLLSKNSLEDYLKQSGDIISVESITKKYPHTLVLTVLSRQNEFLLKTPQKNFVVSNDGLVTDEILSTTSTSSLTSALVPINLADGSDLTVREQVFNETLVDKINSFKIAVPPLLQQSFDHFELTDVNTPDLLLQTTGGLKVYFDTNTGAGESIQKLQLLLSNVAPADLKKLSYIDMRFNDRAYICFKNSACNQATSIPIINPSASSTVPTL